jgi:group I intron endonuclease
MGKHNRNAKGCVYQATCRITGLSYIGKTVRTLDKRKHSHRSAAKRGSKHFFHAAIRKYGFESFDWTVLAHGDTDAELSRIEIYFIATFGTRAPHGGYNLTDGGEGTSGFTFTEEHIDKLSRSHKGIPNTAEQKDKISKALTGRKHGPMSQEQKDYYHKLYKGKKWPPRTVEHIANNVASRMAKKRRPSKSQRILFET